MTKKLDLQAKHKAIILKLLSHELPADAKVWVFGSRSKGVSTKFSDLDLLIDLGKPISTSLLASLRYAFEESDLPYKVDLADWTSLDPSFSNKIKEDLFQIL